MALPLPPGLTPPEVAFLCEMELVTVVPRQRLEGLELLGVSGTLNDRVHPCCRYLEVEKQLDLLPATKLQVSIDRG